MAHRGDIHPNCALCGRLPPGETECPHEGDKLRQAIDQAERRWVESWMANIRDWATNAAVSHVTNTFEALRDRRKQSYRAHVSSLPCYAEYARYRGQPPPQIVPPPYLASLRQQLRAADEALQRYIDDDWKACVRTYPQVLDYYYGQIDISIPRDAGSVVGYGATPGAHAFPIPKEERKKQRRKSATPDMLAFSTGDRRGGDKRLSSGGGSYVVAGRAKIPPMAPPPPAVHNQGGWGYTGYQQY